MAGEKNQNSKEWFLGLDIGTNSVGWAVTDTEYNVLKYRGNAMWGVYLFDEAKTAAERRIARVARRRLDRKNNVYPFFKIFLQYRYQRLMINSLSD